VLDHKDEDCGNRLQLLSNEILQTRKPAEGAGFRGANRLKIVGNFSDELL